MSSRAHLRQHNCRFCQRRSIMIIYNHEQTCIRNPNRAYNIARRYGGGHLSGTDISVVINRRRMAAGLERPASLPTPALLNNLGFGISSEQPLHSLEPSDIEGALSVHAEPTPGPHRPEVGPDASHRQPPPGFGRLGQVLVQTTAPEWAAVQNSPPATETPTLSSTGPAPSTPADSVSASTPAPGPNILY